MGKKLSGILVAFILTSLLFLTSCDAEDIEDYIVEGGIKTKIYYEDIQENKTTINVDIPDVSGVVSNLPWVGNEKFLKAQKENGTDVLMAAYCAVLKDPLPGEEYNVHLAASSLAGIVLAPDQVFSQNKTIGPYIESKGYQAGPTYIGSKLTTTVGGGVCKISSTLYNVSVLSNLQIVERYNHSMPVPYVPYGQDATVSYGAKDFRFRNNTEFPILIWAEGIGNRLYIALYGKEKPPKIEWNHKILNVTEAPKYYKNNPELREGEERVLVEGMAGASVESWVTIIDSNGSTKIKHLGISRYRPMPHIVEINK